MTDRLDTRVALKADQLDGRFALWAGPLSSAVNDCLARIERDGLVHRLFARDASLWSDDEAVQAGIANRLGWLTSPEGMTAHLDRIRGFAEDVRGSGVADVVLLGMGGSSLAPEVLRSVAGPRRGWPAFHTLDSTDPAWVLAVAETIDLPRTLFVFASKSGGTVEPNSMAAYFRQALQEAGLPWARHFVAITDEGTVLHRRAIEDGFREVFLNPSDIGGRYSAVSFFGLVPAALMGLDVGAIVDWARAMLYLCGPERPLATNSAVLLGAAMAEGVKAGRDKVTVLNDAPFEAFGLWAEQLVAESTGKSGGGIVPVAGEGLAPRGGYDADRLLVHLGRQGAGGVGASLDRIREHASDGHPFVQIGLPGAEALGAEFVRWEVATAVAGALLGVNPFDEPNVQQAKDATRHLLDAHASTGALVRPTVSGHLAGLEVSMSRAAISG
ncbi:MAG: transaldolase, partial [Acidobacteriota bacterium]